jgi:glucose/arabinose dehydrogenase
MAGGGTEPLPGAGPQCSIHRQPSTAVVTAALERKAMPSRAHTLFVGGLALVFAFAACKKSREAPDGGIAPDGSTGEDGGADASAGDSGPPVDAGPFCNLPGSIQYTSGGVVVVPGGQSSVDLSYLQVPEGFCVHFFANVGNPRQLRFAPSGELFVASPTTGTTSNGPNGQSAIILYADDNHDGYGDAPITFLANLPSTQGLLFAPGALYYQDGLNVMRLPYDAGERMPSGPSEQVASITYFESSLHWPKSMDVADDGTIYVANGGNQADPCTVPHPFLGGILSIDAGAPDGVQIAQGFRNPIAVRCQRGHDQCFALELSKDGTAGQGGREKMVPIRTGDDWGFPCCATTNVPYPGIAPAPDCSTVATDNNSFVVGETPFGVDFEPGLWPSPWTSNAFVVLHGAAGSWTGARLIAIPTDPSTGLPLPSTDINGTEQGMTTFASGWVGGAHSHGRPAEITFSADGRLFLSNDVTGDILWIAPFGL